MIVYQDQAVQLLQGDVMIVLKTLPDNYVQTVVTSPPCWGLRDYGVEGQLGLEKTPEEYVTAMLELFREVRRVLKQDGTLWLNLGDSYAWSGQGWMKDGSIVGGPKQRTNFGTIDRLMGTIGNGRPGNYISSKQTNGLKPKDLVGIPWRVAFALQADGWYLRSDIIWSKPNPMPESVTDRPTKAHEYLFLLSKSERYWYDAQAIAEPMTYPERRYNPDTSEQKCSKIGTRLQGGLHDGREQYGNGETHNKRSVWTIATQPYPEAHFATFPTKLVEPCILAGAPIGGLVLDPFSGAGTTLLVSKKLNRTGIGIELNADYCTMTVKRLSLEPARML